MRDYVVSRDEDDVEGVLQAKAIEEFFIREAFVLRLEIDGHAIETTAEHPFYVQDKGWTPAGELTVGDQLAAIAPTHGQTNQWQTVTALDQTATHQTVYNFRVADWHTYFVSNEVWGFAVWAHNAYRRFGDMTLPQKIEYMDRQGIPGARTLLAKMRSGARNVSQGARFQARRAVHYYKAGSLRAIEHAAGNGAVDLALNRGNILVENKSWWSWAELGRGVRDRRLDALGLQIERYLNGNTNRLRIEFDFQVFDEVDVFLRRISSRFDGRLSWRAVR